MPNFPLTSKPSFEYFVERFSKEVEKFPEKTNSSPEKNAAGDNIVYKDNVLDAFARHDENGMAPVDRRVRASYHPDRSANRQNSALAKQLREKYERGRKKFLKEPPFESLESMQRNNQDARQVKGLSSKFHFDLCDEHGNQILYSREMGDIFYHPLNDVLSKHEHRQVPKDFKDLKTSVGAIHAYFRDFIISNQRTRNEVIRIFLNSASHERENLHGFLHYIETAIKENNEIADAPELLAKCLLIEERAYQRSLGFQVPISDPQAQAKLHEFFISASVRQAYQLKNYIVDACVNNSDASLDTIIAKAQEALHADNQVEGPTYTEDRNLDDHF
jgi:hypothetical protein